MEYGRIIPFANNVRYLERQSFDLGWDNRPTEGGMPREVIRSGDATVLIVTSCADDPSFLNAILGEDLPGLAYPCPVIISDGTGPCQVNVYWKGSHIPENVSEEALRAESEQLQYCCSREKELYEESRRWLKEFRFIRIERDNRVLHSGLSLILLTAGCVNMMEQYPVFASWVDATVFVGPGLRALDELGQRFLSACLYGARKRGVFFAMDPMDLTDREEQSGLLRHYLAPVFTGRGGQVDEALYNKRVFYTDSRAATRVRTGEPRPAPSGHSASEPGAEIAGSGMLELKTELFEYLGLNRRLYARAQYAPACPGPHNQVSL